jgi:hypothetical protein
VWFLVEDDDVAAVKYGEMKQREKKADFAFVVLQHIFFTRSQHHTAIQHHSEVWVTNGPSYTNFAFLVAHISGFHNFAL